MYKKLCHKVYGLLKVQRTEKREIANYKYTALRNTKKRLKRGKKGEKMISENDKSI